MIEVKKLLSAKDALVLTVSNKVSGTGLGSSAEAASAFLDLENNNIIYKDNSYPIKGIDTKKGHEIYKTRIGKFIKK